MKMTYQPKKRHRSKVHGFRKRMSTKGGRKVLAARRLKGRKKLSAQATSIVVFLLPQERSYLGISFMKFSESLKKRSCFQNVYRNGKSFANRFYVMYVLENNLAINRLGISVSKKVGNSVIRHHITRLVREAYRLQEEMFNSGLDLVIIARMPAKNASYKETEKAILHLGNLHQILKSDVE